MKFSLGLIIACAVLVAVAVTSVASPRKVLVLPVDGNADSAMRTRLDAVVLRLAHTIDGEVKVGATTFADDALVAGCDPAMVSCADTVIGTLGVDELVWGTASTENGTTTLVVKRATKGSTPKEITTSIASTELPEKAEDGIKPMFGGEPIGSGLGSGSGSAEAVGSGSGSAEPAAPWSQEKKLGVGLSAGGGLALAIGFALWANESSLQGQINSAQTSTLAQIQSLKALEDKAGTYATWGDIMVIVGLAAGGAGAYYLWKNHQNQQVTVTPAPVDNGAGATLIIGGRW